MLLIGLPWRADVGGHGGGQAAVDDPDGARFQAGASPDRRPSARFRGGAQRQVCAVGLHKPCAVWRGWSSPYVAGDIAAQTGPGRPRRHCSPEILLRFVVKKQHAGLDCYHCCHRPRCKNRHNNRHGHRQPKNATCAQGQTCRTARPSSRSSSPREGSFRNSPREGSFRNSPREGSFRNRPRKRCSRQCLDLRHRS
jgi:hypothetical protein